MLTSKVAAQKAIQYLSEVYSDDFSSNRIHNLRLEEIERDQSGDWLITIGWDPQIDYRNVTEAFLQSKARIYKQLRVSVDTGDVVWMKIRSVN
jgi:hypothetical protein